ncbi:MAG: Acg family FMN-binding oxidoreductase [Gaiellaceae bacterium]
MNGADPAHKPLAGEDAEETAGMSRGRFVRRLGLGLGTIAVVGAGGLSYRAYDQGVFQAGRGPAYDPWSDWKQHKGLLPLVAAATLAPSPHNTQAWLFRLTEDRIDLFADRSRNIGAIDPYLREMHTGLGAALENLVLAAHARGLATTVRLMPDASQPAHVARVELARATPRTSPLYLQIANRHTNRYPYVEGKDVPGAAFAAMSALEAAGASAPRVVWFTSKAEKSKIGELLVAATEAIVADPDQSRSDYAWFRQSWDEIQRQRDGITVDASGLTALTASLAKLLPPQSRAATDDAWLASTRDHQTRTAAAYGIVAVRDAADNRQRLEGGRLLERIHLWTSGHGIALQHINQLTERADREVELGLAPRFGAALRELLPTGWQALVTFRTGYPTHTPHKSPRRAVEAVIVT